MLLKKLLFFSFIFLGGTITYSYSEPIKIDRYSYGPIPGAVYYIIHTSTICIQCVSNTHTAYSQSTCPDNNTIDHAAGKVIAFYTSDNKLLAITDHQAIKNFKNDEALNVYASSFLSDDQECSCFGFESTNTPRNSRVHTKKKPTKEYKALFHEQYVIQDPDDCTLF